VQKGFEDLCLLINACALKTLEFCADRFIVAGMLTILSAIVSLISRFRRRASLKMELLALRHQVAVLHRQRRAERMWMKRDGISLTP
jgi:hypothetical protein